MASCISYLYFILNYVQKSYPRVEYWISTQSNIYMYRYAEQRVRNTRIVDAPRYKRVRDQHSTSNTPLCTAVGLSFTPSVRQDMKRENMVITLRT